MKLVRDIRLTPAEIAEAFCDLDDEGQAQVFIDVARLAQEWPKTNGGASFQWYLVGKHLKTCGCSTLEAQDMVVEIAEAIRDV